MKAQVVNPKWSHFHEFWMINENASQSWFVDLMKSLMKKSYEFDEMCFESKWKMVKWMEIWVLKQESFSHLNVFVCELKLV